MKKLRLLLLVLMVAVLTLVPTIPVLAQLIAIHKPDSTYTVAQAEVYRNCIEPLDQLYLVSYTCEYGISPVLSTDYAYIGRLMNGAVELGSTVPYGYHDGGYDYGIFSMYFNAADAGSIPVPWLGALTVTLEGNPTLWWLDNTATTAMHGAIADDGGVQTDETAQSNNPAPGMEMNLLPVGGHANNDAYYFGSNGVFDILTVNVDTAGNYNQVGNYVWEYWDGANWVALPGWGDASDGFTVGVGNYDITWIAPTNWIKNTILAINAYWVRFRITTAAGWVVSPLGDQSWTNTADDPPSVETSVFSLWFDDTTVEATKERLTTRIRTLAQLIENDWGGGADLIEDSATGKVLTPAGEDYFTNSIPLLRTMCPNLFPATIITPDFTSRGFVEDYYMGGDDDERLVWGNNWYVQTFTATSTYDINGIWFKARRIDTPGIVTVSIRASAGDLPAGADLVTGTINGDTFTEDEVGAWYNMSFTEDETLTNGTQYSIVMRSAGTGVNDCLGWRIDTTCLTLPCNYAGGQASLNAAAGVGAWAAIVNEDFLFQVTARGAHTQSYRHRLATRWLGTPLDMTELAEAFNLSRMWFGTFIWIALSLVIAFAVARAVKSYKPITMILLFMMPFGAMLGFIYLEMMIILTFLSAMAMVYVYFYSRT